MRLSRAFIPTLKEIPKDAVDASHILLLRGGYMRMVGAGIYEMLPLGQRVLRKIQDIIREEMDAAGSQEILMPALLPANYFQETGRWDDYGDVLLRIKDRKGGDYHLGPTHEEIVTDLIRREVKSYRQLPLMLYQIQMKFRDEPRPRAGLMRGREFLMKDCYSFDVDQAGAEKSYERMRAAYERIFERVGLDFRVVAADSGSIGGDTSAEFQILAQSGEDSIVACGSCDYAANVEVAAVAVPEGSGADHSEVPAMELVETPGVKTIEAVKKHFEGEGIDETRIIKSLVYDYGKPDDPKLAMACVRGDHDVNEVKLASLLGVPADSLALASDEVAGRAFRAKVGYLGPVLQEGAGFDGKVFIDHDVANVVDGVMGASKTGHHYRHVAFGRDFGGELASLRSVKEGDPCPSCGNELREYRGIEGGHIFILGTHYTSKMGATYLDSNGDAKDIVMGCYGIGVTRLMASAIEQHHDKDGIRWPMSIAPYEVAVLALGDSEEVAAAAKKIYGELREAGVEVVLDDRDERPGVKFKDADLIGYPVRVTLGARTMKAGNVEVKARTDAEATLIPLEEVTSAIIAVVRSGG